MRFKRVYRWFINKGKVEKSILDQAKKEKSIIYGARSIQKQIGIFSRHTEDWDILSKKPRKSAFTTEKNLDKIHGTDYYYVKPALHPGTWKVMEKGFDGKKGTKDDVGIVDYTKIPKPVPPFIRVGGIRYRSLGQEKKAKKKSIKDPQYKFRHEKDKEDVNRIKFSGR